MMNSDLCVLPKPQKKKMYKIFLQSK